MNLVFTNEILHGPAQAEIHTLYLWPDGSSLTPALSQVCLRWERKMRGMDHDSNREWVGASAAFIPTGACGNRSAPAFYYEVQAVCYVCVRSA
jgi:hypothetical protein